MSDYIKREDAIAGMRNVDDVRHLKALPPADVAPVRHGHWICLTDCSNAGIYCSACHKKVYEEQYSNTMKPLSPWCPNCGAKMDEDSEPLMEHEVFFGKE